MSKREIPTGFAADTTSRRLSIVIGNVVMGLAFAVVGVCVGFWPVLLGYALWGLAIVGKWRSRSSTQAADRSRGARGRSRSCLLPAVGFLRRASRHDATEPAALPVTSGGPDW